MVRTNFPRAWGSQASNAAALELYRSLGFVEVGIRKGYYDHPKEDARIMVARP